MGWIENNLCTQAQQDESKTNLIFHSEPHNMEVFFTTSLTNINFTAWGNHLILVYGKSLESNEPLYCIVVVTVSISASWRLRWSAWQGLMTQFKGSAIKRTLSWATGIRVRFEWACILCKYDSAKHLWKTLRNKKNVRKLWQSSSTKHSTMRYYLKL